MGWLILPYEYMSLGYCEYIPAGKALQLQVGVVTAIVVEAAGCPCLGAGGWSQRG